MAFSDDPVSEIDKAHVDFYSYVGSEEGLCI